MPIAARSVFITGSTGFMGLRLIDALLPAGHHVSALARPGSEGKLPPGVRPVVGDPLDFASYVVQVAPADTFVHLVGVAHPNPAKARQFREVDLRSLQASVEAARQAGCEHFVFVSVAQPAPVMQAYVGVRAECERTISAACQAGGMGATILRPWYVQIGRAHV